MLHLSPRRLSLPERLTGSGRVLIPGSALSIGEVLILVVWAVSITYPYLNLDLNVAPAGREYLSNIQSHQLWTMFRDCGWCALWNGRVAGGYPTLADPFGSPLHPLVIFGTLGWGILNGSKLALVGAFIMAGVAQWWLCREMKLGWIARLWSSSMVIAAGHLAGRMEDGAFGLVLSTAACGLVLPPLVALCQNPSRRMAVLLGVMLALAGVAGQGYMQFGLMLALPLVLLMIPWDWKSAVVLVKYFAFAAGLAVLLSGPLWIPVLHFLPQMQKYTDPDFRSSQGLFDVPLNLVISDHSFYLSEALHKLPYPSLYVNFVGWIPFLLAILALGGDRNKPRYRTCVFLAVFALFALCVSSAEPLRWVVRHLPVPAVADFIAGVRFLSLVAGLAVPAVLALAAVSVDRLLGANWPLRQRGTIDPQPQTGRIVFALRWLLIALLLWSVIEVRAFSSPYITVIKLDPGITRVLESLRTPDLQWVSLPRGEHIYIERADAMGLKVADRFVQRWWWKDRPPPEPVLAINPYDDRPDMDVKSVIDAVPIYVPPNETFHLFDPSQQSSYDNVALYAAQTGREYAVVADNYGDRSICAAYGTGGDLDITCDTPISGILTVRENSLPDWQAQIDGQPTALLSDRWLKLQMPAGHHTVQFHYRP